MKGVISMSGRKMYSTELKLEVVQRYLKGDIGLNSLAREYHISSKACIQKWLALYREHGKTINFLGVIMSNLNVALDQKERAALYVAQMAKTLGADGAVVAEEGYGNPDADFVGCLVALEDAGVKTIGVTNECTGRNGTSQPLVTLDEKCDAIVSCGNVSELIELPPMETVLGELQSLARDGLSGGWAGDEILGPSVREDGSVIMENNSMFCGDQVVGWSPKTMKEF